MILNQVADRMKTTNPSMSGIKVNIGKPAWLVLGFLGSGVEIAEDTEQKTESIAGPTDCLAWTLQLLSLGFNSRNLTTCLFKVMRVQWWIILLFKILPAPPRGAFP